MDKVFTAQTFASRYHYKQKYGTHDYMYHLQTVANSVERATKCLDNLFSLVSVAWLHDILEDTECTKEILEVYFASDIVDAVVALTKIDDEKYCDYIGRVKSNELAKVVKIHDTLCNLTESVMQGQRGRIFKYTEQLRLLTE